MKALSIRQPWAWLILHGGKDIENRDWFTEVRGRVLVHASKGMTRSEYDEAKDFYELIRYNCHQPGQEPPILPSFEALERGGFVGTVEMAGCAKESTSPWFFGKYGFVLREPRAFKLVPHQGRLGFFDVNIFTLTERMREGVVL